MTTLEDNLSLVNEVTLEVTASKLYRAILKNPDGMVLSELRAMVSSPAYSLLQQALSLLISRKQIVLQTGKYKPSPYVQKERENVT